MTPEQMLRAFREIPKLRAYQGTYVGTVDGQDLVDLGGSRIPASWLCPIVPVGDVVHVWLIDTAAFVMAPVKPRPTEGVISTIAGDGLTVSVTTDSGDFTGVPFLSDYAPSSGHAVALLQGARGLIVAGQLSTDVDPPVAPVPPPPAAAREEHEELFLASGSGSAARGSSNWFTRSVYASSSNIGIYVYSTVEATLARAISVQKVEIFLSSSSHRGNPPSLGSHDKRSVSGPTPTVANQRNVSPGPGWFEITDLADELRAGGGIGFDGNGYTIFRPSGEQDGALRIKYTT